MSAEQLTEEFRPVVGFPGYEVSNLGRVRSVVTGKPIIRKPSVLPAGYLQVQLQRGPKKLTRYIHRLALEAFVGPCPPGMWCRHLNGVPADNRLENLAWGTPAENSADKRRHGTQVTGNRTAFGKLSDADVLEMRRLRREGVSREELAARFGITPSNASRAILGTNYKHLPLTAEERAELRHLGYRRGAQHHMRLT